MGEAAGQRGVCPHQDGPQRKAPGSYWCGRAAGAALIGGRRGRVPRGRAGACRGGASPLWAQRAAACAGTMSWARRHLRAALALAAVSARGATTEVAARRELSARPAPQEPGMEYQVPGGAGGRSRRAIWAGPEPRSSGALQPRGGRSRGRGRGSREGRAGVGEREVELGPPGLGVLRLGVPRCGGKGPLAVGAWGQQVRSSGGLGDPPGRRDGRDPEVGLGRPTRVALG